MSSETSPPDHAASSVVCSHGARRRRSPRSAALLPGALRRSVSPSLRRSRCPPDQPLLGPLCHSPAPFTSAAPALVLPDQSGGARRLPPSLRRSPLNSTLQISCSPPPHLLPSAVPRPEQQLATPRDTASLGGAAPPTLTPTPTPTRG